MSCAILKRVAVVRDLRTANRAFEGSPVIVHIVEITCAGSQENHPDRVEPGQVFRALQSSRGIDKFACPGDPGIARCVLVENTGALGPDPEGTLVLPDPTDEGMCLVIDDGFSDLAADLKRLVHEGAGIGDVLCLADARVTP